MMRAGAQRASSQDWMVRGILGRCSLARMLRCDPRDHNAPRSLATQAWTAHKTLMPRMPANPTRPCHGNCGYPPLPTPSKATSRWSGCVHIRVIRVPKPWARIRSSGTRARPPERLLSSFTSHLTSVITRAKHARGRRAPRATPATGTQRSRTAASLRPRRGSRADHAG
jgi:hypothetical protein